MQAGQSVTFTWRLVDPAGVQNAGVTIGWTHYLAFDLFIGTWIAVEADKRGYNRLLQAPMLVATFMFGPLGLLLFYLTRATETALEPRKA